MTNDETFAPGDVLLVAVPETSGSTLYGMVDMLSATSWLWRNLVGSAPCPSPLRPRIVAPEGAPFLCSNGVPVSPELAVEDDPEAPIVIVPELFLEPESTLEGRYAALLDWLRRRHATGSMLYSSCSGSILLAAAGLLDGCPATSHWSDETRYRKAYDRVEFDRGPALVAASSTIVTAAGTSSWQDLMLHIIARHCGPREALQIARIFLLRWHTEGQLPYVGLHRRERHADHAVRDVEDWLERHFAEPQPVAGVVARSALAERTLKRRFKRATGHTLIDYVQNLRIEEAKRLLSEMGYSSEKVSAVVGYENSAFFRRLFKRLTGVTPGHYRTMFEPIANAGNPPVQRFSVKP